MERMIVMAERVVVAGGGASGLVAAVFAAQNGARSRYWNIRTEWAKRY